MKDTEKAVLEIKKYINTDLRNQPQSIIFRSGVNTGLRIAIRILERFTEGSVKNDETEH